MKNIGLQDLRSEAQSVSCSIDSDCKSCGLRLALEQLFPVLFFLVR